MQQYLDAVNRVLQEGSLRSNRTGVDTLSVFGHQMRFDLREGFPVVTTKKLAFNSVVKELLWFLRGETNIKTLGCGIWDEWAKPDGTVPFCYGRMWRSWPGMQKNVDQIDDLIKRIEKDPNSRRLIVSAWHPELQDKAALAWCHALCQFNVDDEYVDCMLYQRSCDLALGVPFNIASYGLFLHLVAKRVGRKARYFVHSLADMHIYVNHVDGLKAQLDRQPLSLPQLLIKADRPEIWDYRVEDFELVGYQHHPSISFDVAI